MQAKKKIKKAESTLPSSFRVPKEIYEPIKQRADRAGLPYNMLIRMILKHWLDHPEDLIVWASGSDSFKKEKRA